MNKKNFKVIKLNGLSGLVLILLFICAVVGSLGIFPVYALKFGWNELVTSYFDVPSIRLSQAALLWCAVLATICGYLKKRIQFKFVNQADFPENNLTRLDYEKFVEKIKKEQNNDEKINH